MKKILAAVCIACSLSGLSMSLPAQATTKPTDIVQVFFVSAEEQAPTKKYAKAWKDLKMEASTRQRILTKEKEFEKQYFMPFRIHAIRIDGGSSVGDVLYLGPYGMVAFDLDDNEYCTFSLDYNGSMVSGSQCSFL